MAEELTEKQKAFVQEYLIDPLRPVVEQKNQLKDEPHAEGEDDGAVIYAQECGKARTYHDYHTGEERESDEKQE